MTQEPNAAKKETPMERIKRKARYAAIVTFGRDDLIKGLRKYMGAYSVEDVPGVIAAGTMPYIDPHDCEELHGYWEDIQHIKVEKVWSFFVEANPELAEAFVAQGVPGMMFFKNMYVHMMTMICDPEKAKAQAMPVGAIVNKTMVEASCDKCKATWMVKKLDVANVKECPFCKEKV
jgi:hypothetical protein